MRHRLFNVIATLAMFSIALSLSVCRAEAAATWQLNVNLASIHTEAWARRQLNQENPGVGATYQWSSTWAFAGGVYRNSYRHPTYYAQVEYTPLHVGEAGGWHVDIGAMAGIATYRRSEVPCAPFAAGALVRVTAPDRLTASIVLVPNTGPRSTGFIGLELGFRLD